MIIYIAIGVACIGLGWILCSIYHYNHWVNRVVGSLMAYGSGKDQSNEKCPETKQQDEQDHTISEQT